MFTVVALIVAAISAALLWKYLSWRYSPLFKSIPGPIHEFTIREWLFGVFSEVEREPFMQPQQRWWKEAGPDTQMLHYTGLFGKSFICVLDADIVKQILTSKAGSPNPRFVKGLYYLKRVIGDGLVTIDGTKWHRHRKIIQPSFNNHVLKEALNSCIPDLTGRLITAWKERPGDDIDIAAHFSSLTLDIIGKVAFSHEFQSMASVEKWAKGEQKVELEDPLINGLYSGLMPSFGRMILINLRLSSLERFLMPDHNKTHMLLNQAVESVVKRAHSRYKNREEASAKPKCLLELLFDEGDNPSSHNKPLSMLEIQEETKTFLVAGHETTSTMCVWALYCFIQNPDKQKLVFDDIMKHAPKDSQITLESLEKMSYFDAFLSEVLRLYPPVGMIVRSTNETTKLMGASIPAQTRVMIPIYLLHRNPKYWTDPESFIPERWLNGARESKFHHFAYLPFSAGFRSCIGQRFAMWEAKLILAPIIREFEMMLSPSLGGVDLKLVSFITIKSIPAVKICAKQRK